MRAVRCIEGRPTVVDVEPSQGEGIRVRVASAGICGSDLHLMEMGLPLTFGHEGDIHRVTRAFIPTTANLDRQRDTDCSTHLADDLPKMFGLAHELAPSPTFDDLGSWTTTVDIHNISTDILHHHRRITHTIDIIAEDLHAVGTLVG